MRHIILLLLALAQVNLLSSQNFISPVKHEIRLAGTFGELRSNHFHMGLDIKSSRGKYPDPIYAVDEGFISRIKVSRSGYGNAIYIDHPSGYTTVYGHLNSFSTFIDTVVNKVQLEKQSFEIDYYPESPQILVKRGQEIAKMGNSGSSHGPHLHFEVRNTLTESPLNPMNFGVVAKDDTPPIIKGVKFVHLDDKHHAVNEELMTPSALGYGKYQLSPVRIGAWRTGIEVQTYDPMNRYNKNGVYKIELLVDSQLVYSIAFDSISFKDSGYINAHIDYAHYKETKDRFQRCYLLPGNAYPNVYSKNDIIKLYKDKEQKVSLNVYDYALNKSELTFMLLREEEIKPLTPKVFNYYIPYDQPNVVVQNGIKIHFKDSTLYEDLFLYINSSQSEYLSKVYHIGNEKVPLHKPIKVFLDGTTVPDSLREKVCLIECSKSDRISTLGGQWKGDIFVSEIFSFGNYAMDLDTIAPIVTPLQSSDDFTKRSSISFRIEDNFSDSGRAKGLTYNAFIDGKWAKFSYDLKSNKISHLFEIPITGKTHKLLLTVTDDRGNKRIMEKKFIR